MLSNNQQNVDLEENRDMAITTQVFGGVAMMAGVVVGIVLFRRTLCAFGVPTGYVRRGCHHSFASRVSQRNADFGDDMGERRTFGLTKIIMGVATVALYMLIGVQAFKSNTEKTPDRKSEMIISSVGIVGAFLVFLYGWYYIDFDRYVRTKLGTSHKYTDGSDGIYAPNQLVSRYPFSEALVRSPYHKINVNTPYFEGT